MRNILKVDSPNDYARFVDAPVLHPLVSIIHYDELAPFRHSLNNYGVYGLFIQRQFPNTLSYGMKTMQVSDASIIAVEPGQIGGLEDNGERISLCGWVLLWSPELLHGTELERQIDRYQFFSYFFDGSLHMEPDEWLCITQLVAQMRQELLIHVDSPSLRNILLGYLRLILEYCNRIYQRQLFEEDRGEADLLKRFHNLLQTYFRENRQLMRVTLATSSTKPRVVLPLATSTTTSSIRPRAYSCRVTTSARPLACSVSTSHIISPVSSNGLPALLQASFWGHDSLFVCSLMFF